MRYTIVMKSIISMSALLSIALYPIITNHLASADVRLSSLFISSNASLLPSSAEPAEVRAFAEKIRQQLSAQAPFASWKKADMNIKPLGPGTHSWLVSFAQNGEEAGYAVISASEDGGYQLVEYGGKGSSLFSDQMLRQALTNLHLTDDAQLEYQFLYGGPLLAEWRIHQKDNNQAAAIYVDALTGEVLPETDETWQQQTNGQPYAIHESAISSKDVTYKPSSAVFTASAFDPYDNMMWLAAKPLEIKDSLSFQSILIKNKQLVFTTKGDKRTYQIPLSVSGYQKWTAANGNARSPVYVSVGTEQSRFILINTLLSGGQFYKY
ncbi:hypothetical protein PASE110613_08970 [Paenibacillus sediminis]|uniref:Uncharacterized protein n=1 Tax=Paenibacillus sediminis TaxID=664909 RepID=A0ABS4H6A6_9BACL|nr:hypothetical protein [Paenibacillus sediminis]MBP1938056.1 hypothetical protein [Paenibacillus sediminis]